MTLCSEISTFSTGDTQLWFQYEPCRASPPLSPLCRGQSFVMCPIKCPPFLPIMPPSFILQDCFMLFLCIQDDILLFPWAGFAILITGTRHPYIKQVLQDALLAPRLFHTDFLLCFGVSLSAMGCQMTSPHAHWSRRWSSKLLYEAHFMTRINDTCHSTTILRSCVGCSDILSYWQTEQNQAAALPSIV